MSGHHIHAVFDFDSCEDTVLGIRNQTRDRSDKPFTQIDEMGQCILDGTASGGVLCVIDVSIRGSVVRKVLPRDTIDLHRFAELVFPNSMSHALQDGIGAMHIGDTRHQ